MAFDVYWLSYYLPLFGFLFVFTLIYGVLAKTKVLGESVGVNLFIAFIFGIMFVTFAPGAAYVQLVTPWFVILLIALFFMMMIVGLSQKELEKFMKPQVTWVFVGLLSLIFLWSAIVVFNPFFGPYIHRFTYDQSISGAVILTIVAAAASFIITWKGKKK